MTQDQRYAVQIQGETACIGTAAELAVALDVLQGAHDRAVLEQLAPYLAAIIADGRGLQMILRALSTDDQLYLLTTLGSSLPGIIQRSSTLRDILAMLSDSAVEEALLCQVSGEHLRELAATPQALADLLEWIYGASDGLLLDLIGEAHLRRLFDSGYELSLVLAMLDRAQQARLLAMLGWPAVCALVHSRRDLAQLLVVLTAGTSRELINYLSRERLRQLIRDARAWRELTAGLEQAEISLLRAALEVPYAQ